MVSGLLKSGNDALLSVVSRRIRRDRIQFYAPESSFVRNDDNFGQVWFPSGGCRWDLMGHCTMCNFGLPHKVSGEEMIHAVSVALEAMRPIPRTLWVSAFNVLDDREVPPNVRSALFTLLSESGAELIISESHPLTATEDALRSCAEGLAPATFAIELGIESLEPFVRKWCVNKHFPQESIRETVCNAKKVGVKTYANLLVGTPFLNTFEAIADAKRSIEIAIEMGFDNVVVFPCHVKRFTVAEWLYRSGFYKVPSLWAVVEVLRNLSPQTLDRVEMAWLSEKNHPGADVVASPTTCENCLASFLDLGEEFILARTHDSLAKLDRISCECRERFRASVQPSNRDLPTRLNELYELLAVDLIGSEYWMRVASATKSSLALDWQNRSAHLSAV